MATIETEDLISMTDASKIGLSALVREAEEGQDRVLVRNNRAVAVLMSMERFERFRQAEDDLIDITLAASRMLTAGPERHSLDDVLARFGSTREDLAALPGKMAIRVELTDDAVADLTRYAASGNPPHLLKKLLRLEAVGKAAGLPLGGNLAGYRKIVVGDRAWRIIFTTDEDETVATVLVIGDRDDTACHEEAQQRLDSMGSHRPEAVSLAAAMFQLSEMQRAEKKQRR